MEIAARFFDKIARSPTGCWEFETKDCINGYPRLRVGDKNIFAYRYSYEYHFRPIPEGLVIDHLCKNPKCVHPKHLEAVTQQENIWRSNAIAGVNHRKTHCQNGHEFTPANTYLYPGTAVKRRCRTCHNAYTRNRNI